ncbi:MAG: beta-galactosidase [Thermoproteota archaeon]
MKDSDCGGVPSFRFGVDYYPEHWPRERWAKDAEMMAELGFNTVRLAEFAWSRMEPVEGKFDFSWLDEALETLSKHGIKAVLGTPTAAPPPWLVKAHPDILQVDAQGRRKPEGTRKNCCAVNPNYIEHTKRIVEAMVLHSKDNPSIIGWQIDNEFDVNLCYCENSVTAFRSWLKEKYGSVERLNSACGLVFWGQEYGSWDEVFPLRPPFDMQNPALCLEWHRFSSDAWVNYQRLQVEIIRRHAPHHMVTHNFMGLYKELDYFKLARDLDLVSFDYYPKWSSKTDHAASAMAHDVMRSLKKKPYWIMELQSGAVKTHLAPIPKPGEIRLWTVNQSPGVLTESCTSGGDPAGSGLRSTGTASWIMTVLREGGSPRLRMFLGTLQNRQKDWNNNIVDSPLPGRVSDLFGITVEEYTGLPGGEACEAVLLRQKVFFKARNWMEKLVAEDAEVIAEYGSGIYRGKPAATVKRFGKGVAIYVGLLPPQSFTTS